MHGLLVDPGAARGLIGTRTRQDYYDQVLRHHEYRIEYRQSHATLSGIEGKPRPAKDACSIPFGIAGDVIWFDCDSIDGHGSNCPALLSNATFVSKKMTSMASFFKKTGGSPSDGLKPCAK